jgi:Pup amidohydrolase
VSSPAQAGSGDEPLHPFRRPMGVETEYGLVPGDSRIVDPSVLSALLVTAYARAVTSGRGRWNYGDESPLRDLRGFEIARTDAAADTRADDDPGTVNAVLTNGARFYVDHAHPEYSAPETSSPRSALRYDKAGELVLRRAAAEVVAQGGPPITLYKNNTDGKGASYGTHENFLLRRSTPLQQVVSGLTPFLVSRQVICGAGRVGLGPTGNLPGFQLMSRADFIEAEVGLETTIRRPIVNTRDEPHADARLWRRLHLIIGDANLSETAGFVKLATTSLVISMIEADALGPASVHLVRPVTAVRAVSHDTTLTEPLETDDGRRLTALDLQHSYLEAARAFVSERYPDDGELGDLLELWQDLLDTLRTDPLLLADTLDWPAKLSLLERYRDRDGLHWDHPKLALIDLQYSDLRPERGLYHRLESLGRMRHLLSDDEIADAEATPPADTRAWFRGECIRRFGNDVVVASWDSLVFDAGPGMPLHRVPTIDPLRGTRELTKELLDGSASVQQLLARLDNVSTQPVGSNPD